MRSHISLSTKEPSLTSPLESFMSNKKSIKNLTFIYISTLLLTLISLSLHAERLNVLPEAEVEKLRRDLLSADGDIRKEVLVKLQWAGISDERVFDPIMERIQPGKKIASKYANIYVSALTYSGNPKYFSFLDNLSQDKRYSTGLRNLAKKYAPQFEHYQSISQQMNNGTKTISNEEFWANRYEKGLRAGDNVRVRWAARDLYLSGLNEESYEVAQTFLAENYKTDTDNSYLIDTLSFLCKALGLSRNTKYKGILVEVSNNTPNKKLAKYAERSAQYFDPGFKSNNAILKGLKR